MRYALLSCLIWLAAIYNASAQDIPKLSQSPSKNYLLACRTKAAMLKVMDSGSTFQSNPTLVDKLAREHLCLLVPYELIETIGYATDKGAGPAPVTVRSDDKSLTIWGYPIDE